MPTESEMATDWRPITGIDPPHGATVLTKIDGDGHGERNVQTLRRHKNLWFLPDMSIYVYYAPTHYAAEVKP